LQLLADAGLDPDDAARAAYLLFAYVVGSIALEVSDVRQPGRLPPESERVATRQAVFSATPTDSFPLSAAAAATRAGYISTEQYLWRLHRILDGLTALGVPDHVGPGDDDLTGQ
jgi:TetR/AcrR family transcriptional regulator, tetracycline repressor protein